MIKHKLLTGTAAGLLAVGITVGSAGVASATNATFPNSSYGFDGNAHLIVGGGSTTLFHMAQSLSVLWEDTIACQTNLFTTHNSTGTAAYGDASSGTNASGSGSQSYPPSGPAFNQCSGDGGTTGTTSANPQPYAGYTAGGNFDSDTVAIAEAAGSSAGILTLNSNNPAGTGPTDAYEGTNANIPTTGDTNAYTYSGSTVQLSNGYGSPDFAESSRAAKTTGGKCALTGPGGPNDELACDTFWGVGADGVEVATFDGNSGLYDGTQTASGINNTVANLSNATVTDALSAQDLFGVFNCDITTWGDLPEWQAAHANSVANLPDANAPIIPWAMNSNSGSFADFNLWVSKNAVGVPSGWTINNGCERQLTTGGAAPKSLPLENDFKPIVVEGGDNGYNPSLYTWPTAGTAWGASGQVAEGEPTNLAGVNDTTTFPKGDSSTVGADSPQNPNNWIWVSSYGLLTQFPFLANAPAPGGSITTGLNTASGNVSYNSLGNAVCNASSGGCTAAGGAAPGVEPSGTSIGGNTYPIERILSIVTKKSDADCPLTTANVCDFTLTDTGTSAVAVTDGNGSNDLDVNGATSGKGGAVREFVRWLCRSGGSVASYSAATGATNSGPLDFYTGKIEDPTSPNGSNGEIQTVAVGGSGFSPIPLSLRSPGSTCDVISHG